MSVLNPPLMHSKFAPQANPGRAFIDTSVRRKLAVDGEFYARLVSSSSDAILTAALDGTAMSMNPAAETLFGYSAAEVVGQTGFLARLVPPERTEEAKKILEQIREGLAVELETVRIRKNGTRCAVSLAVSPIRDAMGCLLGFSEVVRDITERERQMQAREFLAEASKALVSSLDYEETLNVVANLLVRQLSDCCLIDILESDGSIRRIAAAFSEPREKLRQRLLKSPHRNPPTFAREVVEGTGPVFMRKVPPGFIESVIKDEEQLSVLSELDPKSFLAVPLQARGHVVGALVLISTTMDRQYGPSDLSFAEEIAATAALAIDNARLFAQAERAVSARDSMLGVVAHDLRGPLNTIVMSAELLNSHKPANIEPMRRFADHALKAAKQMERMIQDLLDIAGIESGQLSLNRKPVPASSLVAEALEVNRSRLGGRELRAESALQLPSVAADSGRILQVFSNLIGNAIKFTPRRARIAIGAAPDGDMVNFWVTDDGPGISPEHLPHLFSGFWQAKADRRGLGLGLHICKGIVEAHGGRIDVKNERSHGATFSFSLPIAALRSHEYPAASPARPAKVTSILTDDSYMASVLGKMSEGKHVMEVPKGGTLFAQGEAADAIYFVQTGRVKVSVLSQGGKQGVLAIRGPHSFLGEGSLGGQSLRMSTATALEPVSVLRVEKRAMLRALLAEPDLSEVFMARLLERNIGLEEDLCDQLFNQSEKRLARVLLKLASLQEGAPDVKITRLSHETLAEMVGTTRARITHFMNKFRKTGLIEYDGHATDNAFELIVKTERLTDMVLQEIGQA